MNFTLLIVGLVMVWGASIGGALALCAAIDRAGQKRAADYLDSIRQGGAK